MEGTVNDWKQAIKHAEANSQKYQDRLDAMKEPEGAMTWSEEGATEARRQTWNLVAASIAEALRLESLPNYQAQKEGL